MIKSNNPNYPNYSRGVKLHDFSPTTNEFFIPHNWKYSETPKSHFSLRTSLDSKSQISAAPGYATPIPEHSVESLASLSPAWNPFSRLPEDDVSSSGVGLCDATPLLSESSRDQDENPLLDSRLLNVELRVIVSGNGIKTKELTARVQSTDGCLGIFYTAYRKMVALDAKFVKPKHPNPTRDNGLLVIIKGDHCGKQVRRIHHRYQDKEGIATVILAVVDRVAGQIDRLTGEELNLDASYLCVCEESKEHKRLNSSLMDGLREEARKIRAK